MEILNTAQLEKIKGGREVEKIDQDGDGKWDLKIIKYKNRTVYKFR